MKTFFSNLLTITLSIKYTVSLTRASARKWQQPGGKITGEKSLTFLRVERNVSQLAGNSIRTWWTRRRRPQREKRENRVCIRFLKDNASTLDLQGERPWVEEETRRSTKDRRKRVRLARAPAYRLYPLLVAHTTLNNDTAQLRSRRQTGCGRVRPDHASSAPPNRRPPSFSPPYNPSPRKETTLNERAPFCFPTDLLAYSPLSLLFPLFLHTARNTLCYKNCLNDEIV